MAAKRKPFGGMKIKPDATLAAVVGNREMTPAEMTKQIWVYLKRKKLVVK